MAGGRSPSLCALLVAVGLVEKGTSHWCSNGGRLECMAVQPKLDEQSALNGDHNESMPELFCTPEGQKVSCLDSNGYHSSECNTGELPCCADGSDPHHRDILSRGDDITCTATVPIVAEEDFVRVVLDDVNSTRMFHALEAFEGSYEACMKDAYLHSFHHDGARNKGNASFTFNFDPPKTGCYKIEEYHPGGDWACAQYLPRSVRLDVDYCQGLSTQFYINQAERGGQWNEVSSLMFHQGRQGSLVMRNSADEECSAETCFWVADAFRLTWTGSSCSEQDPYQKAGVLAITAHSDEGDLLQILRIHASVFEAMLEIKLGSPKVDVLHIEFALDRRLEEFGRLDPYSSFEVFFQVYGVSKPMSSVSTNLKQALQQSFTTAGVDVMFYSASLAWIASEDKQEEQSEQEQQQSDDWITNSLIVIVGAGIAAFVLLCAAAVIVWICACRGRSNKGDGLSLPQDIEAAPTQCEKEWKEPELIEGSPMAEVSRDAKAPSLKRDDTWESASTGLGAESSRTEATESEAGTFDERWHHERWHHEASQGCQDSKTFTVLA